MLCVASSVNHHTRHSFPTRRSSDLRPGWAAPAPYRRRRCEARRHWRVARPDHRDRRWWPPEQTARAGRFASEQTVRSEEHTSELQSLRHLVCRLLLEKKKKKPILQV